jgi:ferredoxin
LSFDESDIAVVDAARCKGCGLCIDNCPTDALAFEARRVYHDITTKSVKSLGSGMVPLD